MISWDANSDPDISHYRIYRSDGYFEPGPENRLLETAATEACDPEWIEGSDFHYRVAAVDVHGNEGPSVLVTPGQIVATLLQSFTARFVKRSVALHWELLTIDEGASFRVLRAEVPGGSFVELVAGEISRDGLNFEFVDRDVSPGTDYRYRVELAVGLESRVLFETESISVPPAALALYQNHPNPFNPATTIRYCLPSGGHVRLAVYDVSGRLVTILVDGARRGGEHSVTWNGSDGQAAASSGVYFYRLDYGKESITKKMILLR
jgi:hypothetical protein